MELNNIVLKIIFNQNFNFILPQDTAPLQSTSKIKSQAVFYIWIP